MRDDEKLKSAKRVYIQDQDFNAYENVLRSISHRYIDVVKDAKIVVTKSKVLLLFFLFI
jgi:hypothetical protein